MIYCDTSVLIALLVPESQSSRVATFMGDQPRKVLAISGWVEAELQSALSIKVRSAVLTLEQRADVARIWRRLADNSLVSLEVGHAHFLHAARLAADPASGLRGGDALHLAIALSGGHALATLDHRLANACEAAGGELALSPR